MEIRETSLSFVETEGQGASASTRVSFPRKVERVAVGIGGYSARYEDENDHHLGRLRLSVSAKIDEEDDTVVQVAGALLLRDWSNDIDDPFSGLIDVSLLVDLEPVPTPRPGDPRSDLLATGAEVSQVIQHFRSDEHLDAANVFPDNSVRLVAGKSTIVRLYTDYDDSSGLPPITRIEGELVVTGNGTTTTIPSVESIVPRRDVAIDRAMRTHTVNFVIPENLCRGELDLRAIVSSAADDRQFSSPFRRTIRFDAVAPLPVLAVGINYTGPDVAEDVEPEDLAAPSQADFVDTFEFVETVFPVPSVQFTSYVTADYDEETISDIADGCDKLADLRDFVADFRGDSDDLVYGLYNVGVVTGSVGGCGGGGAGVGRVGSGGTAAHEMGHAVGRKHAPCDNVARCAEPANTDGGYPTYAGFDSDSIGEYGVDPRDTAANVIDPASAHDFMGYSGGRWVSPYTYKALMSAVPNAVSGAAGFAGAPTVAARSRISRDPGEWIPIKQEKLFLRLDIDRHGAVVLHPAFHFPARPQPVGSTPTDYVVELLGPDGEILSTSCLLAEEATCGCGQGPGKGRAARIRQAIPFDPAATKLVLTDCGEPMGEWPIPDAPDVDVDVDCDDLDDADHHRRRMVTIQWTSGGGVDDQASESSGSPSPWALVQWRDRVGTWRGLAGRTQAGSVTVPLATFQGQAEVAIRVLLSTGLATGLGQWTGSFETVRHPSDPDRPRIVLVGERAGGQRVELPGTPRVSVVGVQSGEPGTVRWFDDAGGELARGSTLPADRLRTGQQVVGVSVIGASDRVRPERWLIERTVDGRIFVLRGSHAVSDATRSADDVAEPGRHRSTSHHHPPAQTDDHEE